MRLLGTKPTIHPPRALHPCWAPQMAADRQIDKYTSRPSGQICWRRLGSGWGKGGAKELPSLCSIFISKHQGCFLFVLKHADFFFLSHRVKNGKPQTADNHQPWDPLFRANHSSPPIKDVRVSAGSFVSFSPIIPGMSVWSLRYRCRPAGSDSPDMDLGPGPGRVYGRTPGNWPVSN